MVVSSRKTYSMIRDLNKMREDRFTRFQSEWDEFQSIRSHTK